MITIEEIENLAALVRIELAETEKRELQKDIGAIVEYISQINAAPASGGDARKAPETAPVNVMREDGAAHEGGAYTDALLRAAPQRDGAYIRVKKIL